MTYDDLPATPVGRPRRLRFTRALARAFLDRVASGESQASIYKDPSMPTRGILQEWVKTRPVFREELARARAEGGLPAKGGAISTYCVTTAHEIFRRLCEGESVTSICRDEAMPSFSTVYLWRRNNREFAEAMRVAYEIQAERFCDLGWEMAQAATPETAYLTHVRLGQLRWTAGILSPRTHGPIKPTEPEPGPKVQTILFRHFQLETHPETGQRRVIGYTPDPTSMKPVADSEGEWSRLPEVADLSPEARARRAEEIARMRRRSRED